MIFFSPFAFPKNLHHLTSDVYTLMEEHRLSVAWGKSGNDLDNNFLRGLVKEVTGSSY